MSSTNKESTDDENSPKSLTCEEASIKLEDHRCAVCDNVLINACRISCGHTFCRHCLNLERDNRNERGKPTCFICDAAVTEISPNAARDTEIDDLFAKLSVDERLKRARAKAERNTEEDEFAKRSRNEKTGQSDEGSNESIGSGDTDTDAHTSDSNEWVGTEPDSEQHGVRIGVPTVYFQPDHSFWEEEDNVLNGREFRSGHNYEAGSSTDSGDPEGSQELEPNPMYDQGPPRPVVIHHTVQHIYHTVEVRNTTYRGHESEDHESQNGMRRSPGNSFPEHEDAVYLPSSSHRAHYRAQSSPFPTQGFHGPLHQNVHPTYNGGGYYPNHHSLPYSNMYSNPRLLSPVSTSPVYFRRSENYRFQQSQPNYAASFHPSASPYQASYDNYSNESYRNPDCHSHSPCEYHRALGNEFSDSQTCSTSHTHFEMENENLIDDENDNLCALDDERDTNYQCNYDDMSDDHQRIILNLALPISASAENVLIRTRIRDSYNIGASNCPDIYLTE